jgi:hypothetical protein
LLILDRFAGAIWGDVDLTEARNSNQGGAVNIAFTKNGLVMTARRREIGSLFSNRRKIAVKKGRIDLSFGRERRGDCDKTAGKQDPGSVYEDAVEILSLH